MAASGKEAQAIEVWSDEASQPVAVRYAIFKLLLGSLMNARTSGLFAPNQHLATVIPSGSCAIHGEEGRVREGA